MPLLYPYFSTPMLALSHISVNESLGLYFFKGYLELRGFLNSSRKSLSYFFYLLTCQKWQLCSVSPIQAVFLSHQANIPTRQSILHFILL